MDLSQVNDLSQVCDADLRVLLLQITKILETNSNRIDTTTPPPAAPTKPTTAPTKPTTAPTKPTTAPSAPIPSTSYAASTSTAASRDPNTIYLTTTKRRKTSPPTPSQEFITLKNRFSPLTDSTPEIPEPVTDNEADKDDTVKQSVPPFVVRDKTNWTTISKALKDANANYIRATSRRDGVNVYTANETDYRKMYKTLETLKTPFHTFQLPSEKSLRVFIRGVLQSITCDEIAADLRAQHYTPINIKRLNGRDNRPAPLVMVELSKQFKSIYNIVQVCGLNVTVESKRVLVGQRQCHKCQLYGHTQPNCRAEYRCMKCAGPHSTHECTKPKTTPAKCANCSGEHTSTYFKCPNNPNKDIVRPIAPPTMPYVRPTSYSSAARGPAPQQSAAAPASASATPAPTNNSNSTFNAILGEMLATLFAANPSNQLVTDFVTNSRALYNLYVAK